MSKLKLLIIGSFLLSLLTFTLRPAQGEAPTHISEHELTRGWTTGILSDGVGPANIIATDLEQDGVTETITCAAGAAYALHTSGPDQYEPVWYSDYLECASVAVGDRDDDGTQEIYVGVGAELFPLTPAAPSSGNEEAAAPLFARQRYDSIGMGSGSRVYVFAGDTFAPLATLPLPSGTIVRDIAVSDVDGEEGQEIVLLTSAATLVLDATSGAIEWNAAGFGGRSLAIGNLDMDADKEIVVNGSNGYILNAVTQSQEWSYAGGFGVDVSVGDVDGDGMDEIAYVQSWSGAFVMDGDTRTVKWQRNDFSELARVLVADVDGAGNAEVVIGDAQWGSIHVHDGNTGAGPLWTVANPEHGVSGLAVGDTDNDNTNELIWGAGLSSSGSDGLFIGEWGSGSLSWQSEDLDGGMKVAAGDVDNDGQVEIIMVSAATDSRYSGGGIYVYDGTTHALEWSTVVPDSFYLLSHVQVGQLDSDPALEILVGGNNWYDTRLSVYDGVTHELQWQSPVMGDNHPLDLKVSQLDQDSKEEIIVGLSSQRVQVLDGASPIIEWDSGILDGAITDVDVGNLDGDAALELAILTSQSVYIYEVGTWTVQQRPFSDGSQLAIVNDDLSGAGELLLASRAFDAEETTLHAWRGSDYQPLWQQGLGSVYLAGIEGYEIDGDGQQEFLLYGTQTSSGQLDAASYLLIGVQTPTGYQSEYLFDRNLHYLYDALITNLDQEPAPELLLGAINSIQVNEFRALMEIAVTGPSGGTPDSAHTFTATALPLSDTLPITFTWEATDQEPITHTGGLTDSVTFTWETPGIKTVTVTASNAQGQATVSHQTTLLIPPATVTLNGPAQGLPTVGHTFLATSAPLDASTPLTYTWEATDQEPITHTGGLTDSVTFTWATPGSKTITVTASNAQGQATASHQTTLLIPPAAVTLDGPAQGLPAVGHTFLATSAPLDASTPLTYTWEATGQEPITQQAGITNTASFTWTTDGPQTVTVTVSNGFSAVQAVQSIEIGQPIAALTLTGAEQGLPNQPYVYTGSIAPLSATLPVTYTWSAEGQEPITHTGGLTDSVTFTWETPGTKTITITATNRFGSITLTRTVVIEPYRLYLPVVTN